MELNKENYCFSSMDLDEKDLLHSELETFESLREGFRRKLESFEDEKSNKTIEEQYDHINHRISEIKNNINKLELNNKQDYPVNLPPFIVNEINPPMGQSEITDWGLQLLDIPKIHDLGITGEGIRIAVIDSTPEYSPLIVKDEDNYIRTTSMSELYEKYADKETVVTEKGEFIRKVNGLKVYAGHSNVYKEWQNIVHVLRHEYDGTIKKINTGCGLVDVTPNHSIIGANGAEINAGDLSLNQKVAFCDTKRINQQGNGLIFIGSEDLAWLYGFFSAEGSSHRPPTGGYIVTLSQKTEPLLLKAKEIMYNELNCISSIVDAYDASNTKKLVCTNKSLFYYFREILYCGDEKRVPDCILNAPHNIRYSFLKGYNQGDGATWDNPKRQFEFSQFTTISQILACGLSLLIDLTLDQTYSVYTREDQPKNIQISLDKPTEEYDTDLDELDDFTIVKQKSLKKRSPNIVKRIMDEHYNGFVYDIETEDHTYACGIGQLKLHNTGVNVDHPDLSGAVEKTFNTTNEPYASSNGHAMGSSGVIGARKNDKGILGVAPGCKIIAIKALSESGSGNLVDIIEAINIAIQEGVHIINMSLGGGGTLPALKEAVDRAAAAGILVVSSAGNSGTDNSVGYPAKYPSGFAVASINRDKKISSFSSRGPEVDVAAPGEKILTCWKDNGYATVSGTSFSGPFVSGCFALLLQAGIKPTIDLLKTSSIDIEGAGFDNKSGYGIIDAYNIIKNAVGVRCAAISELTANNITSNSLILSWTGDPSAKSYVVEMKSGEEYKKLTETDKTTINATDMKPDTVYEFRVKPVCDGKESDYSSVSAKTLTATEPPKPSDPPKFDIVKVKQAFDLLGEFLNGLTVQNLSK
jgi:hypothetical protein